MYNLLWEQSLHGLIRESTVLAGHLLAFVLLEGFVRLAVSLLQHYVHLLLSFRILYYF